MKVISLILGLCPGFGGLVHYGRVSHLFTMLLFLLSFNIIIFLDFYWTALVPAGLKKWTFILLGAIWVLLSFIADCYSRKYDKIEKGDATGEKFLEILTVYLRGDWEGAERLAKLELRQNPRDVEIVLFLATLYRHRERYVEATKMHEILERLEGAERWYYEIYIEKNALNRALNGSDEDNTEEHTKSESTHPETPSANAVNSVESASDDSVSDEKSEGESPKNKIIKDNSEISENNITENNGIKCKTLENGALEKIAVKNDFSENEVIENRAVEKKSIESNFVENEVIESKTTERDLEEITPCDIEISSMNSSERTPFTKVSFVPQAVDSAFLESSSSSVKISPVNSSESLLSKTDTSEDNSLAINSFDIDLSQNNVQHLAEESLEPFHLRIVHPEDSNTEMNRPQLWDSAEEESGPQQRAAQ